MKKGIPRFASERAERDFWAVADSADYLDWRRARRAVFPNLRPTLRSISLRLPEPMLAELKLLAHKRDVPYQSLVKVFLAESIAREFRAGRPARARGGRQAAARGR